jgi:ABC-2 type transport system ATP-binding protein
MSAHHTLDPTTIDPANTIRFDNVSKFYGEVLGVNRVNLVIGPGITGLVGPNGSGKSTLMNLMTGLLHPSEGQVSVLGMPTGEPERLFGKLGYCSQYDAFPPGLSGYQFIYSYLRVHGFSHAESDQKTWTALERVGLTDAAKRRVGGYSKGMRQRARVAQAIAHEPQVLIADEPLNGLDPMARAEVTAIFKEMADEGKFILISSHILHEVDVLADRVALLDSGYVVAEGEVDEVRVEMEERPIQVLVRCDQAKEVASALLLQNHLVEVLLNDDGNGFLARTRNSAHFYEQLQDIVLREQIKIRKVKVADSDVRAVYQYLIEEEGKS